MKLAATMRAVVVGPAFAVHAGTGTGTPMRYEVVEDTGEWIVRSDGCELARYADQDAALHDVADRLREADSTTPASFSVRYQSRNA